MPGVKFVGGGMAFMQLKKTTPASLLPPKGETLETFEIDNPDQAKNLFDVAESCEVTLTLGGITGRGVHLHPPLWNSLNPDPKRNFWTSFIDDPKIAPMMKSPANLPNPDAKQHQP